MKPQELLDILHIAELLKNVTRHCDTSGGRRESVAEHSWRAALMAYFLKDEFPDADMDKVIKMCLIHDLGEAFTGDIPAFIKTPDDEQRENSMLHQWICSLPHEYASEMLDLYKEMEALHTTEAKIFKAIDGMEAVIQHNESALESWLPLEYELNKTYASDKAAFSPYLAELRQIIKNDTIHKIETEG